MRRPSWNGRGVLRAVGGFQAIRLVVEAGVPVCWIPTSYLAEQRSPAVVTKCAGALAAMRSRGEVPIITAADGKLVISSRPPAAAEQSRAAEPFARPGDPPRSVLCNILRITYQDGSEEDISSDLAFVGPSEQEFRVMMRIFDETRRYSLDLPVAPPLNSKTQQDIDKGQQH